MKTYEITIEYNETHLYEVKANSEEEAENKLLERHSWPDINKQGSEGVSLVRWIDGNQEITKIEEVK
tara:strand:+ start:9 stop:209 length:201 start_codon:yes stop_codon:yes gene_type:complete